MKVQNKTVIAISAAAAFFASSAIADDFNTVIKVEQADSAVSINQNVVNPDVSIQDYVDSANSNEAAIGNSVADQRSRWQADRVL